MNHTPETIKLQFILPQNLAGIRLDQALSRMLPQYSRARIQNWIKKKEVTVNGNHLRIKDKVQGGEIIIIEATIAPEVSFIPQAINLDILYEDDAILIINKPVGLVVHPAAGHVDQTLLNALLHHCPKLATIARAGIVHRLDKDTSGILVVAKTLTAHSFLVDQLQQRAIIREYEAIVQGVMTAGGKIDAPIGRHQKERTKMAVVTQGKSAVTHYRVLEKFRAHTYIAVKLETGRTHQIRVHMAYIHYPIVGDKTYGGRLRLPKGCLLKLAEQIQTFHRQALHAKRLTLIHPITANTMTWTAPLPNDMRLLLQALREDCRETRS